MPENGTSKSENTAEKNVGPLAETSFTVRVCYRDTDRMGVVYYANYFVYFEMARTDLSGHFLFRFSAFPPRACKSLAAGIISYLEICPPGRERRSPDRQGLRPAGVKTGRG